MRFKLFVKFKSLECVIPGPLQIKELYKHVGQQMIRSIRLGQKKQQALKEAIGQQSSERM